MEEILSWFSYGNQMPYQTAILCKLFCLCTPQINTQLCLSWIILIGFLTHIGWYKSLEVSWNIVIEWIGSGHVVSKLLFLSTFLSSVKGSMPRKKIRKKCGLFPNPPRAPPPPPPVWSFFTRKKLTPIFFFRNKTLIGWNKFYTWSHLKIYYFLLL